MTQQIFNLVRGLLEQAGQAAQERDDRGCHEIIEAPPSTKNQDKARDP